MLCPLQAAIPSSICMFVATSDESHSCHSVIFSFSAPCGCLWTLLALNRSEPEGVNHSESFQGIHMHKRLIGHWSTWIACSQQESQIRSLVGDFWLSPFGHRYCGFFWLACYFGPSSSKEHWEPQCGENEWGNQGRGLGCIHSSESMRDSYPHSVI